MGSTGSIGCNALEVAEHLGDWEIVALSAHNNTAKLLNQIERHRPRAVAVSGNAAVGELKRRGLRVYEGPGGLAELVEQEELDAVLLAVVGAAGLPAALATVQRGLRLALANKESLVVAGSLLIPEARRTGATIIPVDSEHSAVFQALQAGRPAEINRIILTASGGPFRTLPLEKLDKVTPADALKHPTWKMGEKITIDSATMFNKGLEVIEACWLFDLPPGKVQVVVHPESVVHSMVEFVDGSVIAQLSPPDMRLPIQYALTYPQRVAGLCPRLDLSRAMTLNFHPPDPARYPALQLAYQTAEQGGTLGAVLNAANEVAVQAFLTGRIGFGMIWRIVALTIRSHDCVEHPSLDNLLEADAWARSRATEGIREMQGTE